jgi:hypothetical protein
MSATKIATLFVGLTRAIAFTTLTLSATAPLAFGAEQPEVVFDCTNLVSGAGWQIRINFGRSTVDSSPARISSTEISWHAADGGNYTLDRKTGSLTVIFPSSTGGYSLHDRCSAHSGH